MVILLKCDSVTELLVMIISYISVVYIRPVLRYFINRISTCIIIIGYHFGERLQKWVKNSLRQFYISISVVTIIGMHYIVTILGRLQNEPTVPFTRLTQTIRCTHSLYTTTTTTTRHHVVHILTQLIYRGRERVGMMRLVPSSIGYHTALNMSTRGLFLMEMLLHSR